MSVLLTVRVSASLYLSTYLPGIYLGCKWGGGRDKSKAKDGKIGGTVNNIFEIESYVLCFRN